MEQTIFNISLTVSFLMHAVAFSGMYFKHSEMKNFVKNDLEVVYYTEIVPESHDSLKVEKLRSIEEKKFIPQPKILPKKYAMKPVPVFKDIDKGKSRMKVHRKLTSKVPMLDQKRLISVPILKSEKITNPRYINYHERIRQKIKNRAYFYVDNPQFQTGEVYLTFILSDRGQLKQIKILDNKTVANEYLRHIGERSIRESSPFPPFPPDLQYPELTFNVVISFQLDE